MDTASGLRSVAIVDVPVADLSVSVLEGVEDPLETSRSVVLQAALEVDGLLGVGGALIEEALDEGAEEDLAAAALEEGRRRRGPRVPRVCPDCGEGLLAVPTMGHASRRICPACEYRFDPPRGRRVSR